MNQNINLKTKGKEAAKKEEAKLAGVREEMKKMKEAYEKQVAEKSAEIERLKLFS